MCKQIEFQNSKSHYFSRVNSFCPVQNNQLVTEAILITTYDLSTLYPIIQHNKLKNVIRELIHFCFIGGEKQFIAVIKFGAIQTDDKNRFKTKFVKATLKLAINFLLDNFFFNFGNLSFRQIIVNRMGSDLAPFVANLFLYENKWLLDSKRRDL